MPGPPFLYGKRVDLHTVVEADAEFIARGRDDPTVRPWLPRSRPHAVAELRECVDRVSYGPSVEEWVTA